MCQPNKKEDKANKHLFDPKDAFNNDPFIKEVKDLLRKDIQYDKSKHTGVSIFNSE